MDRTNEGLKRHRIHVEVVENAGHSMAWIIRVAWRALFAGVWRPESAMGLLQEAGVLRQAEFKKIIADDCRCRRDEIGKVK